MIATPDCPGTVGMFFDLKAHRHERCWSMMLWPIELYAAGNPRPSQTHERGFDNVLAVEEVIPVRLVNADVDASANLRQDHDTQKLVLQMNRLPCVLDRIRRDAVRERQWVHPPTTALIDPFFEKHGVLVGRQRMICRDHDGLRPRLHGARLIGRCVRKFQSLHRWSSQGTAAEAKSSPA